MRSDPGGGYIATCDRILTIGRFLGTGPGALATTTLLLKQREILLSFRTAFMDGHYQPRSNQEDEYSQTYREDPLH